MSQKYGSRGNVILLLGTLAFILACSVTSGPINTQPTFDPTKAALEFQSTALSQQLTQAAAQNVADAPTTEPPAQLGPSATAVSTPTEVQQKFFTEEFDADVPGWSTFLTRGEDTQLEQYVKNGFWVFDLKAKFLFVYSVYDSETYDDVRIDVRAENRGDNTNNISIICRYDEDNGWYEFNMYNSGVYKIFYGRWKSSGTQASYVLLEDGGSNAIRQGKATNDYTVICKGSTLSLFINGEESRVANESLYALDEGQVGVGVSSFERLPVRVDFDWVKISQP